MILSDEQAEAFDLMMAWLSNPDSPTFVLGGYAGTGKTTLTQHFIGALEDPDSLVCCTPTGKAAAVLAAKLPGHIEVKTLHSHLYFPNPPDPGLVAIYEKSIEECKVILAGEFDASDPRVCAYRAGVQLNLEGHESNLERLKTRLKHNDLGFTKKDDMVRTPLVIVDECSMVQPDIEKDLRACSDKILFVGDPGQLPPVEKRYGRPSEVPLEFFKRNPANFVLRQVQRQAADSPILQFATALRSRQAFSGWVRGVCERVPKLSPEELAQFDQVITGMNITRRTINRKLRKLLFHVNPREDLFPVKGERLICLRNNKYHRLTNGLQASVLSEQLRETKNAIFYELLYDDRVHMKELGLSKNVFLRYVDEDNALPSASDFDYAYAITVHKSQGSEWPAVAVIDDGIGKQDHAFRRRWLYTAVTRAKSRLAVVG